MPTKSKSKILVTTSPERATGDLAARRQAPAHPGRVFRLDVRDPLGISQAEAARRLGISNNMLNMIEGGRAPVTATMATKLQALTGVSAEFWAQLQMQHDVWHALRAARKVKRLIPGEPFPASIHVGLA